MELTTSYQRVGNSYIGNNYGANYYVNLYAKYSRTTAQQTSNKSTISVKTTITCSQTSSAYSVWGTWIGTYTGLFNNSYSVSATAQGGSELTLDERSIEVSHNDNGKYSTTIGLTNADGPLSNTGATSIASTSISLPQIPRYATCNQSLNSKTETTIKMNWSSDNTIDYVWYSKNNGSSWTAIGSVNATSGSYSITGLSPNTAYNIKTRVRRKDSQLTTDSSALSVTTYKAPTHSLKSKTETSIVMNWSADSTIDYIWYSKDNGTNWTGVDVTDGTSGTYTISGLSANTTYNVKTRLRRKATQTTYDCSAISITTYNYPYVTAVTTSNLIIGNSQKLTLYNPLSRTVTVKMNKDSASGTQLYSGTTNSTSITFTPTTSTLYASIPSSKSAKCVYSVVYSTSTKTTSQYTYSINEANCIPTFNNFTYADVDTTITSLTGNNQLLVNNNSNCQFTISTSNKATAKNSASIVKYKCEWGSKSTEVSYSSTADVTARVDDSTGNTLKVTTIDSRGLSASVTKTITNIAYVNAIVNEATPERKDGIDVETYLKLKLTLWNGNWKNGSDTAYNNQLKYVGYRVYDGSSWTSYFDITSTVKTDMSSYVSGNSLIINVPISKKMTIHANGTSGGFEIGKEYKIQVLIKDGTSTTTFTPASYQATLQGTVTDGKVGFSRYKDSSGNYHYGINGMPNSSYNFNVNGTGYFTDVKISTSRATFDNSVPCSGAIELSDIYNLKNYKTYLGSTKINNTWYNIISTRHRNRAGDGKGYGVLFYSTLLTIGNLIWNKQTGPDKWQGERTILDSSNYSDYALPKTGGTSSGDIKVSKSSGDTYFRAIRSDTGTEVYFGVGSGGANHGVWSSKMNKWLVYSDGTNGYLNGNATSATQASQVKNTLTNPTTMTRYYPIFFSGIANETPYVPRTNDGLQYSTLQGTTSAIGRSLLTLGNETSTGKAGNKRGELRLYSEKQGNNTLIPFTNITSSLTNYLPQHSGYMTCSTSLYQNDSGSNGTITLSETSANFAFLEIYYGKNGQCCQKVYNPNGKRSILLETSYSASAFQTVSKRIQINGNSITTVNGTSGYGNIYSDKTCDIASENTIEIYKVLGYK